MDAFSRRALCVAAATAALFSGAPLTSAGMWTGPEELASRPTLQPGPPRFDKETRLYNEMRLKHWATDFPSFVCEQSGWPRPWS